MVKRSSPLPIAILAAAVGVLALTALLTGPGPAQAAPAATSRYVYTKGEDTGECTRSSPCRTIQYALTQGNPGDTIIIAGGTYTGTVNVDKAVTLEGGYNVFCVFGNCSWTRVSCNPSATVLDGMGVDRVVNISSGVAFTANCLTLSNGNAENGGGLYAQGALTVTLSNAVVSNNLAVGTSTLKGKGGGVYIDGGYIILSGLEVMSNTAYNFGGGIYLYNISGTLSGNDIYNNTTYYYEGGGIYLWSGNDVTLTGNHIYANSAYSAGGVCLRASNNSAVTDNHIYNNSSRYAGGIWIWSGNNITLTGNHIYSNTAEWSVGGIHISESNDVILRGNRIYGNVAQYPSGGASLFRSDVTMTNNVVAENGLTSPVGSGVALLLYSSSARLLHTTIARNAGGAGIKVESDSTLWMTNTILVSHTVGITVAAGSTATLQATLWGNGSWANTTDWAGPGTILTGTVNIWGDPDFVDPDAGDYHIGYFSAAAGAGVEAGVTTDIDDDPRPFPANTLPDLGADEIHQHRIHLPLTLRNYP